MSSFINAIWSLVSSRLKIASSIITVLFRTNSFLINYGNGSAQVSYCRYGRSYHVNLPYRPELVRLMARTRVYLLRDGQRVDITQQPGIPYLVTARMLGGDGFVIVRDQQSVELGPDDKIEDLS